MSVHDRTRFIGRLIFFPVSTAFVPAGALPAGGALLALFPRVTLRYPAIWPNAPDAMPALRKRIQ